MVALEVRRGLVSADGAKNYGVVVTATGALDGAATDALRDTMRSTRSKLEVFDFGPPIEDLRQNCAKDTGLPAPKQPVWRGKAAATVAAE
jgi:N-methylhydantoinase B